MALQPTLSATEHQAIVWMRKLTQTSPEWKLTLTMHQRKEGGYLQIEPTPYLKVSLKPDAFLAVE
jgi:hypothetical protein